MPIQIEPYYRNFSSHDQQEVIRDLTIDGEGDVALEIVYPAVSAWHWPTLTLQNVCIKGNWKTGIRLKNCWNARLIDCCVTGQLTTDFRHPIMDVGIDCGTSMDVHIVRPSIAHAKIGIRNQDPNDAGHAEGFHVEYGWFQHCQYGVKLDGSGSGGWPTPVARIIGGHYNCTEVGVWLTRYSGFHVQDVDFYLSPFGPWPIGLYVQECYEGRIGNRYWRNVSTPSGVGVAIVNSHDVILAENVAANTLAGGCVIDGSSTTERGVNRWKAPLFVNGQMVQA